MMTRYVSVLGLLCLLFSSTLFAQNSLKVIPLPYSTPVKVCDFEMPFIPTDTAKPVPDFDGPHCRSSEFWRIDPQNKNLWVEILFNKPVSWEQLPKPYGLYFFAKASSSVYLNGVFLGDNGVPGFTTGELPQDGGLTSPDKLSKSEIPGKLDVAFHIPDDLMQEGQNQLVLNLSAQHSLIALKRPLHFIGFAQFGEPRQMVQRYSMLGLMLLGAFVIGALYFGMLSIAEHSYGNPLIFSALCVLVALQLTAELLRGLVSYSYPLHDIRLMFITACSFGFGITLLAYSAWRVSTQYALHWIYIGVFITAVTIMFAHGFDAKTTAGIFIPLLLSSLQLLLAWRTSKETRILRWLAVQVFVLLTIVLTTSTFHEIVYFLIMAALLLYLVVQQAMDYRQQQAQMQNDRTHIAKLEYKLEQNAQSKLSSKLEIANGGKVEFIQTCDIAYGKAAGDYVELFMLDLGQKLYSGSLKQLEEQLPSTFVRVHRSYLVNLDLVVALNGSNSAKDLPLGEHPGSSLSLTNHQKVPVSRRLLPMVRETLKSVV